MPTAIATNAQVHVLIFNCLPQAHHQDDDSAALPLRQANLDVSCLQPGHKVTGVELKALVGVKDLWSTVTSPCHMSRASRQNSVSRQMGRLEGLAYGILVASIRLKGDCRLYIFSQHVTHTG